MKKVLLLSFLTLFLEADVYKYYLKNRPAYLFGRLGDHTYFCVKERGKNNIDYGCHNMYGISSGGKSAHVWTVYKTKNSKLIEASIATQRVWQCRQFFPFHVLCHQVTNRGLYAIPTHPTVGWYARGYYNGIGSYYLLGAYGKHWDFCKRATYGRK